MDSTVKKKEKKKKTEFNLEVFTHVLLQVQLLQP